MPKKRDKSGKGRSPAYTLYARIDPAIGEALERYMNQARPQPTATAMIEWALEKLLTELGHWPPPDVPSD